MVMGTLAGAAPVDRPARRIEHIDERIRRLTVRSDEILAVIQEARLRLVGEDSAEDQGEPGLKEAAGSEIRHLEVGVDNLDRRLSEIDQAVRFLETL